MALFNGSVTFCVAPALETVLARNLKKPQKIDRHKRRTAAEPDAEQHTTHPITTTVHSLLTRLAVGTPD